MKRILIFFCVVALLAGLCLPARGAAEDDHPITLSITCDPEPELEGDGVIPDLLFTIRNTGDTDYTLENAKLIGGYENIERVLTESITVLAGGTKEFHLTDVPVLDEQLNHKITYKLSWEESKPIEDEETGIITFETHRRETTASITLDRFIVPELSVSAACEKKSVRADEKFEVVYTIRNDTAFDMTGLRLYDPEQSMQSIPLPDSDLSAGDSLTVRVTYQMGLTNMKFDPRIEYIVHRREMETQAETALIVESVVVDLVIETEMRPATAEGTTFAVTIRNNGSHSVKNVCLYDEINTLLSEPFDLVPEGYRTVLYTVLPAVSSDRVRTVRFHVRAIDPMDQPIEIADPQAYTVVPYIMPDSVQLGLSVILKSPYYNEDGKLCASIQFVIRNSGEVKLFHAVLKEITLFGEVKSYEDLRHGDTYFTQIYQLDGVKELKFRVEAVDPAGVPCSSDIVRLDLSGLKELADRKNDTQHVYTQNAYFQDVDQKYGGLLRIATIIGLSTALVCAIVCVVLYAVEIRIKNKLPAEFEDEMERTLRNTKRRTEKQLFSDAPTEQFGYTAPIKLRNYGELTEEEAKARRALYEKGLRENIRKEGAKPSEKTSRRPEPVRIESDGTRVIPVVHRSTAEPKPVSEKPKAPEPPVIQTVSRKEQNPAAQQAPASKTHTEPEEEPIRIYEPKRTPRPAIPEEKEDNLTPHPAEADLIRPPMPEEKEDNLTAQPAEADLIRPPMPPETTDDPVPAHAEDAAGAPFEQESEHVIAENNDRRTRKVLRTVWRSDDPTEPEPAPAAHPDPEPENAASEPAPQSAEAVIIPPEIPEEAIREDAASEPAPQSEEADIIPPEIPEEAIPEDTDSVSDTMMSAPDLKPGSEERLKLRKLNEIPAPARRAAVLHPIKRMEH